MCPPEAGDTRRSSCLDSVFSLVKTVLAPTAKNNYQIKDSAFL